MLHITDELVGELARKAIADKRSITRALAGLPVKGSVGERIARALEAAGLSTDSREPHATRPPEGA